MKFSDNLTPWRYNEEDGVSADYGLAEDEFMMGQYQLPSPSPEPTLRLYTYKSHCALVGRFQNIEAELDIEACRKEGIQYGRRPTGGGAIIMGREQLGVCLTASNTFAGPDLKSRQIYELCSAPIIQALESLGIQAKFRPRNDLEVEGKKIAGLGVYSDSKGALLFHASLLVDLDLPLMLRILRIPLQKISDKTKIKSVSQRITTLSQEVHRRVTVDEIRDLVKNSFEEIFRKRLELRPVSVEEKNQTEKLAQEKYRNSDWIFQNSPHADMNGESIVKTPDGLLRTHIALKGDIIKSVLITGDFFELHDSFSRIEAELKWQPFERDEIARVVNSILAKSANGAGGIMTKNVTKAIWRAGQRAMLENRHSYDGSCYYPKQKPSLAEPAMR